MAEALGTANEHGNDSGLILSVVWITFVDQFGYSQGKCKSIYQQKRSRFNV
jgi:hypothetical protein